MGALSRALLLGSAGAALYVLVARARVYWPFTVDDTFITLRYARHLAEGLGPSWNPGGPPAEGYTAALWMLLLAIPHALGSPALWFAKVLGVLAGYGSLLVAGALAFELARTLTPIARRLATITTFALAVAYWPTALHAISGMETALGALLLTTFALVSVRHLRVPTAVRARSLALLALLSTLTRPETALACLLTVSLQLPLTARSQRLPLLRALGLFWVLPGALYFAARYAHFGLLLPLPFYVKATGQARFAGLSDVRQFFALFVWQQPWLGLLALYGVTLSRAFVPALLGLAGLGLFFVFPAHVMGFEGRYLFPLFPGLAALVGVGFARLAQQLLQRMPERGARVLMATELALALVPWLALAGPELPIGESVARARWLDYGAGLTRAHIALATRLRKARLSVVRPTIALLDVGAVAYYSEWTTLDTYGLNDARVALSQRRDVAYVFAQRPELLVVVSRDPQRFVEVFDYERPLYTRARQLGYRQLCSYPFEADYHLLVLERPDSLLTQAQLCTSAPAFTSRYERE
jgi:arabinofuranosyltransferase